MAINSRKKLGRRSQNDEEEAELQTFPLILTPVESKIDGSCNLREGKSSRLRAFHFSKHAPEHKSRLRLQRKLYISIYWIKISNPSSQLKQIFTPIDTF